MIKKKHQLTFFLVIFCPFEFFFFLLDKLATHTIQLLLTL